MKKIKLLMHTCCAPCSVYCINSLRNEGIEPTLYWYNPNIHPYSEYKSRRDCLKQYTQSIGVQAIFEEEYGLNEFCKNVINNLQTRCTDYCYKVRLEQTAKYAKKHGYNAITTTLLVSPYQKHEELKKIAEEIAKKYEIEFLYRDFRIGFKQGQQKARELGMYMQKYCGCIFSAEMSKIAYIKKDKEESDKCNRETEKRIRLSNYIQKLDFHLLKRENKEEIDFIYCIKKQDYKKYIEKNKLELKQIENKLFERYIKEKAKCIKIITINEDKVGFFDGKVLEKGIFEIEKIFLLEKYQNIGIEKAIINEILIENKILTKQKFDI